MQTLRYGSRFAVIAAALAALAPPPASSQPADDEPTIEALQKGGWQVSGYTSTMDNWSTFILFRHPDQTYLVQCRTGYDVTREPHIRPHCYKLR